MIVNASAHLLNLNWNQNPNSLFVNIFTSIFDVWVICYFISIDRIVSYKPKEMNNTKECNCRFLRPQPS